MRIEPIHKTKKALLKAEITIRRPINKIRKHFIDRKAEQQLELAIIKEELRKEREMYSDPLLYESPWKDLKKTIKSEWPAAKKSLKQTGKWLREVIDTVGDNYERFSHK